MSLFETEEVILKDKTIDVPLMLLKTIPKCVNLLEYNHALNFEEYSFSTFESLLAIRLNLSLADVFDDIDIESMDEIIDSLDDVFDMYEGMKFEYEDEKKFYDFMYKVPNFSDFMKEDSERIMNIMQKLNKIKDPDGYSNEFNKIIEEEQIVFRYKNFKKWLSGKNFNMIQ